MKLTQVEREAVRQDIEDVMLRSAWRASEVERLCEEHGIKQRMVYDYRKQVLDRWKREGAARDIEDERVDVIQRLRSWQAKAIADNRLKDADRFIAREISILGLEHPRVIEARLTGADGGPIQIQAVVGQIVAGLTDQLKAMPTELVLGTFGSNGNGNGNGAGGNGHGGTIDAAAAAHLLEGDAQEDPGDGHGDPERRTRSTRRSRKG